MRSSLKVVVTLILTLLTVGPVVSVSATAQTVEVKSDEYNISILVNGTQVNFTDQKPYITNRRTMVPASFMSKALGAQVQWDNPYVIITQGTDRRIQLTIGDNVAIVNGGPSSLDVAPEIIGGRTMVPLGFVSQALGAEVKYYPKNDTLSIVKPSAETNPAHHIGDTADDTCIWINPNNKCLSLILGDDKQGGLCVWNLDGTENQYLDAESALNNLDIRYDFNLGKQKIPLVGVVNENEMCLNFYTVDSDTRLVRNVGRIPLNKEKPYGGCMYLSDVTKQFYFFANWKDGTVQQWQLEGASGEITGSLVRTFNVGSQVEGCVADDQMGYFYIGEEDVGVWKYSAEAGGGDTRTMVDSVDKEDGGHLTADVEGLTIYYGKDENEGYLICSSQGNSTFQVYDRKNNKYLHSFTVGATDTIDETTETDGCDVSNVDLGGPYTEGVFIAHDHIQDCTDRTNVKLVPWKEIKDVINANLGDGMWHASGMC